MKVKAFPCLVVVVVVSLALVLLQVEGQGARCGDGVVCTGDRCCSRYGWCGMTADHCGAGCQSICRCGRIAGGVVCTGGRCCSAWGWCGTTPQHCGSGCQSNCRRLSLPPSPLRSIFSEQLFTDFLVINRNNASFPSGTGFDYPYPAFITAANSFPEFAHSGDLQTNKREIAAFFAHTSNQTPGWFADNDSEDLQTKKREIVAAFFSHISNQTTDLVAVQDAVLSFKTAIWFWMRPQAPNMPSCHEVITGKWSADIATNVINGGRECGFPGPDSRVENRLGYYKRYCDLLGVSYGDNLDFYNPHPFNNGGLLLPGASSST